MPRSFSIPARLKLGIFGPGRTIFEGPLIANFPPLLWFLAVGVTLVRRC